jgi:hypothetical protein
MIDEAVLVTSVSRSWLRARSLATPAVALLAIGVNNAEGRVQLGSRFLLLFVLTFGIMSLFLRFLLNTFLNADDPQFPYRTKRASYKDEDLPILIQVILATVSAIVFVLYVPQIAGLLAGVFAGLAAIFSVQAIVLKSSEKRRRVVFCEPSGTGNAPSGCYATR